MERFRNGGSVILNTFGLFCIDKGVWHIILRPHLEFVRNLLRKALV